VETTYLVPLASTTELGFRLGPGGRQVRRERGGRPPGPPSPWIRPWDKSSAADPIPVPVLKGCTHAPVQPLAGHRLRTCFFQGLVRSNALTTHDFTVLLSQLGLRKWIGCLSNYIQLAAMAGMRRCVVTPILRGLIQVGHLPSTPRWSEFQSQTIEN